MAQSLTENLYLLEVLVDKVNIDPNAIRPDVAPMLGETIVEFKFLDNAPLDIRETDWLNPQQVSQFKSGKSILFCLTPEQAREAVHNFLIHVTVSKAITGNVMPDKMVIGETDIQIVEQFNALHEKDQCAEQPTAKMIRDTYKLSSPDGPAGNISIFMRVSCFGKLIVTQFQMNLQDRSVLFKDNQGNSMYRYRKSQKDKRDEEEDEWGKQSPEEEPHPCLTTQGEQASCMQCATNTTPPPCIQPPPPIPMSPSPPEPPDDRCYQEIAAEMNGNALTIRIIKEKKFKENSCCPSESGDDYCCCGGGEKGRGSCESPNITALPEGPHPPALQFKVAGCTKNDQNVRVVPPYESKNDKMQVTEISDPKKDVFILKIGKKSEGQDKKSNLELELKTPKGIDRKPPPQLQSRETQYSEADCGPASPAGKGGKGGKGKGKK